MARLFTIFFLVIWMPVCSLVAQNIKIQKLKFGSSTSSEMAPFYKDSVLYFSSNKKNSWVVSYYDQNKESLYHIYQVNLLSDSSFSKPSPFMLEKVSPFNTGSIYISKDGKECYVTKNHFDTYKEALRGKNNEFMGIYSSYKSATGWDKAVGMPFNSLRDYNTGQPTFTPDGNTMFFVSDTRYGQGKCDIFYSEKKNGTWTDAQNLGKVINTVGNEVFPYFHPSGKLFFASDGYNGKGGLDIYYSVKGVDGWSTPLAYDDDINSEGNDFGFYLSEDETWGVFASNRNGPNDKLYRFDKVVPTFDSCRVQIEDSFCYTLFEDGPYKSDQKNLVYKWSFGDGVTGQGDTIDHCFPGPGSFHIKLDVYDLLTKVELFTVAEYDVDIKRSQQIYIKAKKTVKVNELVTLDVSQSFLGDFVPKDYYWQLGDGSSQKGITIQHVFKEKGTYLVSCGAVSSDKPQQKMCSSVEIIVTE